MRQLDREPTGAAVRGRIDPCGLAFDIDGVIADTMSLFLDIGRDEYDIAGLSYEDIVDWDLSGTLGIEEKVVESIVTRILDGDYRTVLRPLEGAGEVLSRIGRRCGSLLMVTARPHPGPIERWMHQQLDVDPDLIDIVCTGSFDNKLEVLQERRMTHFVEDRLDTCVILEAAGLVPILFSQPWNRGRHGFIEVSSWRELETLIAF